MLPTETEARRLHTLHLYELLDTANEKIFDDLTKLATQFCDVPISLISLVDKDRQWFKSKVGLDVEQTPREHSICATAIHEDQILIVKDASADSRFASSPLVTGDPNIRFYAGANLVMESGEALGTLCVIDTKPRELSDQQIDALLTLRDSAVAHMEVRRSLTDLAALKQLISMCAWCRKVKSKQNPTTWIEPSEFLMEGDTVSHSMCPSCATAIEHE